MEKPTWCPYYQQHIMFVSLFMGQLHCVQISMEYSHVLRLRNVNAYCILNKAKHIINQFNNSRNNINMDVQLDAHGGRLETFTC